VSTSPLAEDLKNEPCPVDDLGLPLSLEIALLHRTQCGIDHNEADVVFVDHLTKARDRAAAEQSARARPLEARDLGAHNIETNALGEPDRLFNASVDRTTGRLRRTSTGCRP
jgi:hypothetical protein